MEISYLGHSSFKLKSKELTIITDPFDPKFVGLKFPSQKADIVTCSHQHQDHNYLAGISGGATRALPFVIDRAGEYEVGGVEIRALTTYHDNKNGEEKGRNLTMIMRIEDIFVVHLGDIGHQLNEKKVEEIGLVDVLIIPVGGRYTIDAKTAVAMINLLEPGIVIPMHYQEEGLTEEFSGLASVAEFLKEIGADAIEPEKKLKIIKSEIPETMKVSVMAV